MSQQNWKWLRAIRKEMIVRKLTNIAKITPFCWRMSTICVELNGPKIILVYVWRTSYPHFTKICAKNYFYIFVPNDLDFCPFDWSHNYFAIVSCNEYPPHKMWTIYGVPSEWMKGIYMRQIHKYRKKIMRFSWWNVFDDICRKGRDPNIVLLLISIVNGYTFDRYVQKRFFFVLSLWYQICSLSYSCRISTAFWFQQIVLVMGRADRRTGWNASA